jgi:RND superfamily putative drug exporter
MAGIYRRLAILPLETIAGQGDDQVEMRGAETNRQSRGADAGGAGAGAMGALARFVLRHPRKIVAFWVIVLLISGGLASKLGDRVLNNGYTPAGSQSAQVLSLEHTYFGGTSSPQLGVVVSAERPSELGPRRLLAVRRAVRPEPGVETIGPPVLSPDRTVALMAVELGGDEGRAQTYVPAIRSALEAAPLGGAQSNLIGQAAIYDRMQTQSKSSLQRSALISTPVLMVILLIAFVSLTAAALPLILAAICVGVTFGMLYLLSYVVSLSIFVEDAVLVLGLGLSIDFSLFMLTRMREAMEEGADPAEAIVATMQTTGRAITVSGLTIVVALGALYVTGIGIFGSLATGSIGATLLAVATAVTLVPALLFLFGTRIERFPLRVAASAADRGRLWSRLGDFVVRHRVATVLGTVSLLVVLAIPLTGLTIGYPTIDALPKSDPAHKAYAVVQDSFGPGAAVPAVVIAKARPAELRALIRRQPGVSSLGPIERGTEGYLRVAATMDSVPDSAEAEDTVKGLRAALAARYGGEAAVGGTTAQGIDVDDQINARTPTVVLVVLFVEILLLTLVFGAPLLALKAALTPLLSVGAALGAMVFLFDGTVITYFVPLFLFTTVFGLSTDYEVFLLSRMRESHDAGLTNDESIKLALMRSGRSITLAGIAMSVVFFAFAISPLAPFQELGVAMGLSILIDVTIVRCLLVPATVSLLGEWNWWTPRRSVRARDTQRV